MATTTTMEEVSINNNKIDQLFENLEAQKTLLTNCTDIYKTLTSHFTSLQKSIDEKTLTLESKLQSLDSIHQEFLDKLENRENEIPNRLISLSSEVESKKESAIDELQKRLDTSAPLMEVLKSLCKRMDNVRLIKFMIGKRKELTSLRDGLKEPMKGCVDPARMVMEVVKEFVESKGTATRMSDRRWACGMVVSGLFPPEELKEKGKGVSFSRKTVAEAEALVRDWKERSEKTTDHGNGDGDGDGDGADGGGNREGKMWSAELAMFLQVVVGFGLTEIFEEEFYNRVVMDFSARRDMAKLAIPIFGDKLSDFIGQLIKNGKQVEAIYFASEAGLTEKFRPPSLLQSGLMYSRRNIAEILKKGNNSAEATEEADAFQMMYIRSVIKCVEDLKLEAEFSIDNLKKKLSLLEKAKADKKRGSESSKPSNKRAHGSGGPSRRSGPPPRPAKRTRYPSYVKRDAVPSAVSPVSRYLSPYNLSGQTAYDPGLTVPTYGQRYGGSLVPSTDQITQQHYGVSSGSVPSASYVMPGGSVPSPSVGTRLGSGYGLQSAYGVYDYGAASTTSTSQPPPYAP